MSRDASSKNNPLAAARPARPSWRRTLRQPAHGLDDPPAVYVTGAQPFALVFLCLVLLILSRLDYGPLRELRNGFTDLAAPVLEAASLPAARVRIAWQRLSSYADVFSELEALRDENLRLRQWEWQAKRLERRLAHMRSLLNAVEEPALQFKSSRVIADARGPFARSVLLNVGSEQGVKPGYAVINPDGLVAHVVHVGATASRALLLNDLNSRIPVLVGPMSARAVLAGDNAGRPRLEFMPEDDGSIYEGDEVYTSGDDGFLPRGLRIGVVEAAGPAGRVVRPYAKLDELEYVSVLFFDSPVVPDAQPSPPAPTRQPPRRKRNTTTVGQAR